MQISGCVRRFSLALVLSSVASVAASADFSFAEIAAGSPQTVTVAASSTPAIKLSSASLAFGNEPVGATSATESVTVTNSGTGPASLTSIGVIGGQNGNYALSETCGSSLAAGAACRGSVTIMPVSAAVKSASINIVDNAAGSPQSVSLAGTGSKLTASPTFSPDAGSFAIPRLITIRDSTVGANIYYTTDGSTPTTASQRYSGAVCVKNTEVIKALALAPGDTASSVSSAAYTISAKGAATTLHSFLANPSDGAYPVAGVVMDSDGTLFGTTSEGGAYGAGNYNSGTAYKVTACSVETMLHSFGNGSDGNVPMGELLPDGHGSFYGTTYGGGAGVTGGYGTVFKITSIGVVTLIHSFPDAFIQGVLDDGERPAAPVIADGAGNLYGTTLSGQSTDFTVGSVFKISAAGVEKVIYNFGALPDGRAPAASLTIGSDGDLWGTTTGGGKFGNGTVFKVTPGGTETVVYSFGNAPDGLSPSHGLLLASDGNFYGTTPSGGLYGAGTIFKITPSGTETVVHSFGKGTDGANPQASLIQGTDGNLYGTTMYGGAYAPSGTVFKATLTGKETVIYSFPGNSQGFPHGEQPVAPVLEDGDGSLYGTTKFGGAGGFGTVFKLNRVVPLVVGAADANDKDALLPSMN